MLDMPAGKGQMPQKPTDGVAVLNPRDRVPISLIIDDSTCLVNLAHFCIPAFQEVFPDRYRQPWKRLPREIPDAFVRKWGEWCREHGVKGKYSVIPYGLRGVAGPGAAGVVEEGAWTTAWIWSGRCSRPAGISTRRWSATPG